MSEPKYRFDGYRAKAKDRPFPLYVDEDETILVLRPTADQAFDSAEAEARGDQRGAVREICGDKADRVLELFGPVDASAFNAFMVDLQKFHGQGESTASSS